MTRIGVPIQVVAIFALLVPSLAVFEQVLQVNLKHPVNDVSDKFVSFSVQPEVLLDALNGPNRDLVVAMAKKLGSSNLKINGHFDFMGDVSAGNLQSVAEAWGMLNGFTRAMDWKMVIPVQYEPYTWNPVSSLSILNISSGIGIEDCIWQLGLDFKSARASSYASDLATFHLLVNAFKNYVHSWKVVGADITAGSNPEEAMAFVDLSQDFVEAVGWTQPSEYHMEKSIKGYIYDNDMALRNILRTDTPVWLTLPQRPYSVQHMQTSTNMQHVEGLQWAQTLGNAAHFGFDVVYKHLDKDDLFNPTFSYFVSVFFKKLMGSKVFNAKILTSDSYTSRLYSHCAKDKSGGVAFMGVNTEETAMQMMVRTSAKFTGTEVWQYVLSMKDGATHLNGAPISSESMFEPFVKIKHPNLPFSLNLPAMSVGFWILPLANNEECLVPRPADQISKSNGIMLSRTDKLLQMLIADHSLAARKHQVAVVIPPSNKSVSSSKPRDLVKSLRPKRFILEKEPNPFLDMIKAEQQEHAYLKEKNIRKRENSHWYKRIVLRPFWIRKQKRTRRSVFGGFRPKHQEYSQYEEDHYFRPMQRDSRDSFPSGDIHVRLASDDEGKDTQLQYENDKQKKRSLLRNMLKPSNPLEQHHNQQGRSDASEELDTYLREKAIADIQTIDERSYKTPSLKSIDGSEFHDRQKQLMADYYHQEPHTGRLDIFGMAGAGSSGESFRPMHLGRRRDEESPFKTLRKAKSWFEGADLFGKRMRRSVWQDDLPEWKSNLITKEYAAETREVPEDISKVYTFGDLLKFISSSFSNVFDAFHRTASDVRKLFT